MIDFDSTVLFSIKNRCAEIKLNNEEKSNRLSPGDLSSILDFIQKINNDENILALTIKANGKYFCSGFDINSFEDQRVDFEEVTNAIEDARPVTIAVLHGGVYGGGTDIALACDFRIGCENTDMFMPAARLGLHFYGSGLHRYVRKLGLDSTKKIFLTAEKIISVDMMSIGFLTHFYNGSDFDLYVNDFVDNILSMAPFPLIKMKENINKISKNEFSYLDIKKDVLFSKKSKDFKEGVEAWKEKRKPIFIGS